MFAIASDGGRRSYQGCHGSFSAGTLGPIAFGLSVRDSCLVILFFNLLCCIPPAYLWVTHSITSITHY
jgi:purine-cytosine permease-like protein